MGTFLAELTERDTGNPYPWLEEMSVWEQGRHPVNKWKVIGCGVE